MKDEEVGQTLALCAAGVGGMWLLDLTVKGVSWLRSNVDWSAFAQRLYLEQCRKDRPDEFYALVIKQLRTYGGDIKQGLRYLEELNFTDIERTRLLVARMNDLAARRKAREARQRTARSITPARAPSHSSARALAQAMTARAALMPAPVKRGRKQGSSVITANTLKYLQAYDELRAEGKHKDVALDRVAARFCPTNRGVKNFRRALVLAVKKYRGE